MNLNQKIRWEEPTLDGGSITRTCTVAEAIRSSKKTVAQVRPDFTYTSDQEALDDFLTVHWAELVK